MEHPFGLILWPVGLTFKKTALDTMLLSFLSPILSSAMPHSNLKQIVLLQPKLSQVLLNLCLVFLQSSMVGLLLLLATHFLLQEVLVLDFVLFQPLGMKNLVFL